MISLLLRWTVGVALLTLTAAPTSAQWNSGHLRLQPTTDLRPATAGPTGLDPSLATSHRSFSLNMQESRGRAAASGAAIGAVAGAILFYVTSYPCSGDVMFCEVGFVSYGAIGAFVGGLAGYLFFKRR